MAQLENGNQLLIEFGNIAEAGYNTPVMLNDAKVGFSVRKNYPSDIRFKPAKTPNGEDDDVAVIWVVYDQNKKKPNDKRIPIRLRAATMSKYRAKNWDYDFTDKEFSPTEESVIAKNKSSLPLDINLVGAYFYDIEQGKLIDESGNQVTGSEILNSIFTLHCDTVHPIKSIPIRSKNQIHALRMKLFEFGISCAVWLLKNVFGRTLDERQDRISYFHGYEKADFKKISVDSIEVAGYKAAKRVIILFTFIVAVAAFSLLPVKEDTYVGNVLRSELLTALHCVLLLFILDEALPNLIFWAMNRLFRMRMRYINSLPI